MSIIILEIEELRPIMDVVRSTLLQDIPYDDQASFKHYLSEHTVVDKVNSLIEYHVGRDKELECQEFEELYDDVFADMIESVVNKTRALRSLFDTFKYLQLSDNRGTVLVHI